MAILRVKDENGYPYDIPVLKGDKGDPGYTPQKGIDYDDGYTPVKGVDYFTPDEIDNISKEATAMITPDYIGASPLNHTHNYAGSSSVGGAATSANKLNTNAGSATQPVYFSNGVPVNTTYTLGASVPSGAKFTDTVYTHPTSAGNKHIPSGGASGQILRWSSAGTAVWGADNTGTNIVKLWENASPTSAFNTQTISLDLNSYTGVIIECTRVSPETMGTSGFATVGKGVKIFSHNGYYPCTRNFSVSTTGVLVGDGVKWTACPGDAHVGDNGVLIPYRIYGIKGVS